MQRSSVCKQVDLSSCISDSSSSASNLNTALYISRPISKIVAFFMKCCAALLLTKLAGSITKIESSSKYLSIASKTQLLARRSHFYKKIHTDDEEDGFDMDEEEYYKEEDTEENLTSSED